MMAGLNLKKRTIGVSFNLDKAEIKLWAPFAKSVELLLTGNNKKYLLKEASFGYWELETEVLKPGDLYRFVLDGENELPDPASISQPESVHGPSQVVNLQFDWTDQDWEQQTLQLPHNQTCWKLGPASVGPEWNGNHRAVGRRFKTDRSLTPVHHDLQ